MSTVAKEIMKQYADHTKSINERELVVLLDNCLKDVPRTDKKRGKECNEDLSSNIITNKQTFPKTLATTNMKMDPFIDCQNENLSISDPIVSGNEEDYAEPSDQIKPATQTLSLAKSVLLDLQIPIDNCVIDNDHMTKHSIIEDDSVLCWGKLVEPVERKVKTPLTSGNSSAVDLELTPPSSVASSRSVNEEDRSTCFEDTDFEVLPEESSNVEVNKQILTDKYKCKELCVEIVRIEPTLQQLQVLYTRNDNCGKTYLKPKRNRKQFIPFMFEQAEYMKKKKRRFSNVFHSTPKVNDTSSESKKFKKKNNNTKAKVVCKLQMDRNFEMKQLKMSRKQKKAAEMKQLKLVQRKKEAFEKQQLKLVLKQKKEALKYRNRFDNALDSINRRICNQNTFWRMLTI